LSKSKNQMTVMLYSQAHLFRSKGSRLCQISLI